MMDVELLTIQIRLLIASVEKAREIGLDWWMTNPDFSSRRQAVPAQENYEELQARVAQLEAGLTANRQFQPVRLAVTLLGCMLGGCRSSSGREDGSLRNYFSCTLSCFSLE